MGDAGERPVKAAMRRQENDGDRAWRRFIASRRCSHGVVPQSCAPK